MSKGRLSNWSQSLRAWTQGLPRPWRADLSLANKCLLLFGAAVVLIVLVALSAPWFRMNALVEAGALDTSRRLVDAATMMEGQVDPEDRPQTEPLGGIALRRLSIDQARDSDDEFIARAVRVLERDQDRRDYQRSDWDGGTRVYKYARAERVTIAPELSRELTGLVLLERASIGAAKRLIVNMLFLISAGSLVLGLATLVFYLVTHNLILSPVRSLKDTAERVRQGHLDTRSDIQTGDEFQELAETFNLMLSDMSSSHEQLRSINIALDVKLAELAKANTALFEAARVKGEFLASVSHELRTPLNSVIGFAELLLEIANAEQKAGDDSTRLAKRIRYLSNIVDASRRLLEMIETLLEMAKIEAGKVQLRVEPCALAELCEGLVGLVYPLAEDKGVDVKLEVGNDIPVIETDVKMLHQIVFNFLSNAIKFIKSESETGRRGSVTVRVERLPTTEESPEARVRISVLDSGPGIAEEHQRRIFDKFEQVDGGLQREHQGTGLGLAICRELAGILQGEIQLVSEVGTGSMFSVILPTKINLDRTKEIELEAEFRATLAGRRSED